MSESPTDPGNAEPQSSEDSEFDKLISLGIGSVILSIIVLILTFCAGVTWRASIGYYTLTAISLVVAGALVVTWTPFYRQVLIRAGGSRIAERVLVWFREKSAKVAARPPLRYLARIRLDRRTLGLWIPYVVNLLAVGWLIYFSGGIVRSPFATVPVIMFTLVVLLIDLPTAIERSEAEEGTPADSGDALPVRVDEVPHSDREDQPSRYLVFPFKVLFGVALSFFVVMIVLNCVHPWHLHQSPTAGATLTMTLAIASVGIGFAVVARANILDEVSDASHPPGTVSEPASE